MVAVKSLAFFAGIALLARADRHNKKRATQIVPESYIVTLKPDVKPENHLSWVSHVHARSVNKRDTHGVGKVYSINDFKGYSGTFDKETIEQIKKNDEVVSVEPNAVWSLDATMEQPDSSLKLPRDSPRSRNMDLTNDVDDDMPSVQTFAYVVDTGLYTEHKEFEGRAIIGYDIYPNETELHGHGTHVAGIIGSRSYGVAKKTTLISVRVLGSEGSGNSEGVLQGYSWAVNNITAEGRQATAVINMSLGSSKVSEAINSAVAAAYKAGVITVVAASNDARDAACCSPASAKDALAVGAIDYTDNLASFSNFGSLVDIYAPGVDIVSLWNDKPNGTVILSGTSFAAPHIAGLVLYFAGMGSESGMSSGNVVRQLRHNGSWDW